jgi:hypothetical protein
VQPSLKGFKMTTLTLPNKTESDLVEIILKNDVWIENKEKNSTNPDDTIRLRTNTPVLDEETGAPKVDRKTKLPVTKLERYHVPRIVAMNLYKNHHCEFVDIEKAFK